MYEADKEDYVTIFQPKLMLNQNPVQFIRLWRRSIGKELDTRADQRIYKFDSCIKWGQFVHNMKKPSHMHCLIWQNVL